MGRRIKTSPRSAEADRDGRARRALATRQRILDSISGLVRAGVIAPTCEQVAAGAGISPRSVFLHFEDMSTLYEEVYGSLTRVLVRRQAAIPATVPLETRLRMYAGMRGQIAEHFGNFSRTAVVLFHNSPRIQEMIAVSRRTMRETVTTFFAAELASLGDDAAWRLSEAIVATTTWETWFILRQDFGYSVEAAEDAFVSVVGGLLQVARVPQAERSSGNQSLGAAAPGLSQIA